MYRLAADSESNRDKWMDAIQHATAADMHVDDDKRLLEIFQEIDEVCRTFTAALSYPREHALCSRHKGVMSTSMDQIAYSDRYWQLLAQLARRVFTARPCRTTARPSSARRSSR